jgi:hypothetical protein
LLTALPALALILSTAWEQRRQAIIGASDDALRLARLAASDHARLVEGARSLLIGLAQLSDVQMHNAKACTALFAKVQQQLPLYTNIGAIRPDGEVFCSTRLHVSREPVSDTSFFRRAYTARESCASSPFTTRSPGCSIAATWRRRSSARCTGRAGAGAPLAS